MRHSIIIPHKDRTANLRQCLNSITRSAHACGIEDYEIVVVDNGTAGFIPAAPHVVLLRVDEHASVRLEKDEPEPFWKPRLLNIGIEQSTGDALTFLDADAVVGERFLEAINLLPGLTRLAYRVRKAPIISPEWGPMEWRQAFADYDAKIKPPPPPQHNQDVYPLAWEGYGQPDNSYGIGAIDRPNPVFGNSQFSISREVLGDLRFDENYIGRGFEDLSFIRSVWERAEKDYTCKILCNPAQAMFHIDHLPTDGFGGGRWNNRNMRRYYGKKMVWVVGDQEFRRRFSEAIHCIPQLPCGFTFVSDEAFDGPRGDECNDGLDVVVDPDGPGFLWCGGPSGKRISGQGQWLDLLNSFGIHGTHCQLKDSLARWQ